MESRTDLLRGTLDLLILRSLTTAPLHGLGIARRIAQMTQGSFDVKAGSLFPALYRLEERGLLAAEWGDSDTQRRAKFYRLTRLGRKQLQVEEANWRRVAIAMEHALGSTSRRRVVQPSAGWRRWSATCSVAAAAMRSFDPTLTHTSTCSWTRRLPPVWRPGRRGGRR